MRGEIKQSKRGIVQIVIGVLMFLYGFYLVYQSPTFPTYFNSGMMLRMGAVFVLWGLREIFGGLIRNANRKN